MIPIMIFKKISQSFLTIFLIFCQIYYYNFGLHRRDVAARGQNLVNLFEQLKNLSNIYFLTYLVRIYYRFYPSKVVFLANLGLSNSNIFSYVTERGCNNNESLCHLISPTP